MGKWAGHTLASLCVYFFLRSQCALPSCQSSAPPWSLQKCDSWISSNVLKTPFACLLIFFFSSGTLRYTWHFTAKIIRGEKCKFYCVSCLSLDSASFCSRIFLAPYVWIYLLWDWYFPGICLSCVTSFLPMALTVLFWSNPLVPSRVWYMCFVWAE